MRVSDIVGRLRHEYGSGSPRPARHPTDALIRAIISQQTSSANARAAFACLKSRYPSWEAVAAANTHELADTIRTAGLANIKAGRIQAALIAARDALGTMDISRLADMDVEMARSLLLSLPGVGPNTADCVLLFAFGLPSLPIDTHVLRLSKRIGLIGGDDNAEQARASLSEALSPEDIYDFHVNLIAHGRTVCRSHEPLCEICVLQEDCMYFARGKSRCS